MEEKRENRLAGNSLFVFVSAKRNGGDWGVRLPVRLPCTGEARFSQAHQVYEVKSFNPSVVFLGIICPKSWNIVMIRFWASWEPFETGAGWCRASMYSSIEKHQGREEFEWDFLTRPKCYLPTQSCKAGGPSLDLFFFFLDFATRSSIPPSLVFIILWMHHG